MTESSNGRGDKLLEKINPERREVVERILKTTAFTAPVIASFSLDGLTVSMAHAAMANGSGVVN